MKQLSVLTIILAALFSSCSSANDTLSFDLLVIDSVHLSKFPPLTMAGQSWDNPLGPPDLHLSLSIDQTNIYSDVSNNITGNQHSFLGLNWQLSTRLFDVTSTISLLDYDGTLGSGDLLGMVDFKLTEGATSEQLISTDGRVEMTIYYHHD